MGLFAKTLTLPRALEATALTLTEPPLPRRVILPLRHYIGEPAEACVAVGEEVKVGQLIGTAEGPAALPLHATISGTVVAITEHLHHTGARLPAVIIEGNGADTWAEPDEHKEALTADEMVARIQAAGLMRKGAHPLPLAGELAPVDRPATHLALTGARVVQRIDTLIICALDPEPSLGVNRYLAGIESEEVARGIAALRTMSGAEHTVVAVDRSQPPSPQLTEMVRADEQETTTMVSVNGRRFPAGLPIPLIKAVLGREVPLPFGHPRDVGVALFDLETALSVGQCLTTTLPPVETLITVGGGALGHRGVVRVRVGVELGALIESLGGLRDAPAKVILGGPMTGVAQYDLGVPITKEVSGLFALTPGEIGLTRGYRQCINCGRCVAVCPVNLVPGALSLYCARDRFDAAEREGLLSCLECGCCDYVCPSRRPLVHLFRHAKHQLLEGM